MILCVPRETFPDERRVALVPELIPKLLQGGLQVRFQPGAGTAAGFSDAAYSEQGAGLEPEPFGRADILIKVQPPTPAEIDQMKEGAVLVCFLQPSTNQAGLAALAARQITAFAMELMPRITRAQAMDALSAMSTVAGYKAVLLAANRLPRFFPLLMTAAGTLTPARVLVIGAGVAGLQAIGTAKRLGAVVEAYDPRPAAQEQVRSLGARFVDLGLEPTDAEAGTGYAKAQTEEFYRRQRERMSSWLATADVVITTALVPGQRAPLLITEELVGRMRPGSVIVDLAAEQGGNCALTEPNRDVLKHGVVILGPVNLPSSMPFHASQMYARTVVHYLLHLFRDGRLHLDRSDELTHTPLVTHRGEILYAQKGTCHDDRS
jgi:NAD(P) transhydrogenase subunit alpha